MNTSDWNTLGIKIISSVIAINKTGVIGAFLILDELVITIHFISISIAETV